MSMFNDSFFNQQYFFPQSSDHHYLDLNEYFANEFTPNTQEPLIHDTPARKLSDPFAAEPMFIPFDPRRSVAEPEPLFTTVIEAEAEVREQRVAPSIVTKNVCFNICQKTVKVIKQETYGQKLDQICAQHAVEKEAFLAHILKQKKNFTGPKALQLYVDQQSPFSAVFRDFMRWFLKEKYLRHCLTGDMDNKEAYIKYKNEVILVILG